MACEIPYIPNRLHRNGRENIVEFEIGELLFRRCPPNHVRNPFDSISLVDVSVNREGPEAGKFCEEEDVLYITIPNDGDKEKYEESICRMQILELNDNSQYEKRIDGKQAGPNGEQNDISCTIKLKHKSEDCNYAHSAFEFYYDEEEVTWENFKATLGKDNKGHRKLRTTCKTEISKMILKEEVRINW